jgi:integrase
MKINQLSARKVQALKERGYYLDGGGLYLQVSETGTKSWIFRFTVAGVTRDMGLGSIHNFTLAEARERARTARQLLADGINPIEQRRKARDEAAGQSLQAITFKDAARRFVAMHGEAWRNEKHRRQWESTLRQYAFPTLGDRPVSAIEGQQITEALAPIWTAKAETARRVKQRIERICQWVKDGTPLPNTTGRTVKHHSAMAIDDLPAFMVELRERESISAKALEFTILTAARTSEALGATWREIDLKAGIWSIPANRMKAGKAHDVPLSKPALALLKSLPRVDAYLFPGAKDGAPLSNMAMLELLRGMRGHGLTVHGFRSTFRDWAGDRSHFPRNVIEHALAHQIKDKAEAAYRRSSALEKRRKLMDAWASYCDLPMAGDVVTLRRA